MDLIKFAKQLKIPHFKGVYMLDELKGQRLDAIECGIINLDTSEGVGSHWVAFFKNRNTLKYFDSFGNLRPPTEVLDHFKVCKTIVYNHDQFQTYNETNCGHLCLKFLKANVT